MKRKLLILVIGLVGLAAAYPPPGQRIAFGTPKFFDCIAHGYGCGGGNSAGCCDQGDTCCCNGSGSCVCRACV